MNLSPVERLIARHVCTCTTKPALSPASTRLLSTSLRSSQQYRSTPSLESQELLRRRYQKRPEDDSKRVKEQAEIKKRMRVSGFGIALCMIGLAGTVVFYPSPKLPTTKNDAPPSSLGILDATHQPREEIEQVDTGTSTIPKFPKHIYLADGSAEDASTPTSLTKPEQEYQLVGLGIRTVFYLEVYVAGIYIATPDIDKLQERLIRQVDPVATTLVPGERDKLKTLLLNNEQGAKVWNEIIRDGDIRTAIRIVPTRNTDFVHLRDGWVRGITAKTQQLAAAGDPTFSDESFGLALNGFKTVLGGGFRKKVPWGETIFLTRNGKGVMNSWYEDKTGHKLNLGSVQDERISRLLWLIYLGGPNVSSEPLRRSVVDGVMEFVERPVGTVATQVV